MRCRAVVTVDPVVIQESSKSGCIFLRVYTAEKKDSDLWTANCDLGYSDVHPKIAVQVR